MLLRSSKNTIEWRAMVCLKCVKELIKSKFCFLQSQGGLMFSQPVKRVGINQYSTVFSCYPNTLLPVLLHLPLNKVLTKQRKTHHLFIISPSLINNCHCHWFFLSHTLSFFCPSFSPVLSIMPTSLECVRSLYYELCVHNGILCAVSVL